MLPKTEGCKELECASESVHMCDNAGACFQVYLATSDNEIAFTSSRLGNFSHDYELTWEPLFRSLDLTSLYFNIQFPNK